MEKDSVSESKALAWDTFGAGVPGCGLWAENGTLYAVREP